MSNQHFPKKSIAIFFISFLICLKTFAQSDSLPLFKSQHITVNAFSWVLDEKMNTSQAQLSISNTSTLTIKSVSIYLTGQDKNGVMLQSGGTHTLKKKTKEETIHPKETKTISFEKAFNGPMIKTINLKQVTIEYENGSVEILN